MSGDPAIAAYVAERGITEVLHFTTNRGLVGILARGRLLARDHLNEDEQLESVKLLNCEIRKDPAWTGHISMSINTVNKAMLNTSQNWHEHDGIWWAVLAFDPAILEHHGVYFTTTNNTYTATVRRNAGIAGLADMYSEPIPWGYYGSKKWRQKGMPKAQPTDAQAEVLYPGSLSLEYLRGVSVPEPEHLDEVAGIVANTGGLVGIPVLCRPEVFQ